MNFQKVKEEEEKQNKFKKFTNGKIEREILYGNHK